MSDAARLTDKLLEEAVAAFDRVLDDADVDRVVATHFVAEPTGDCLVGGHVDKDRVGPGDYVEVLARGCTELLRMVGIDAVTTDLDGVPLDGGDGYRATA